MAASFAGPNCNTPLARRRWSSQLLQGQGGPGWSESKAFTDSFLLDVMNGFLASGRVESHSGVVSQTDWVY